VEPQNTPSQDPLDALRALADELAGASRSPNTRRTYASVWKGFERWALANGLSPLPASADTVAVYVAHLVSKGRKTGTVQSVLVAISQRHLDAGFPSPRIDPRVRHIVRGVRRKLGANQCAKNALTSEHVDLMIATLGTDLRGLRNRAILALGFASGMRRSELVALRVSDLALTDTGATITIRVSKWNAAPRRVRVAATGAVSCPIVSFRAWIQAAGLDPGAPAFPKVSTTGRMGVSPVQDALVARLVKAAAARVGLDEKSVSAHSLRSGFATSSARAGVAPGTIQRALGHATAGMTLRYVQEAEVEGSDGAFHLGSTR
jgi:integrase